MNGSFTWLVSVSLLGALVASCTPNRQGPGAQDASHRVVTAAVVEMYPVRRGDVHGLLHVRVIDRGVLIRGNLTGLKAGLYGFGLHQRGDCSAFDGTAAASPAAAPAVANADPLRRLDDLVVERTGGADVQRAEATLTLSGPESIVGKTLIVEAWPFDPKTDAATVPIVACGVVRAE